jgi:anti-sigma B factor antagonist
MQLSTRQLGDVIVFDVSGALTMGDGAVTLREAIRGGLDLGIRKFVVNLADCTYVDSAGMGELMTALIRIRRAAGQLRLLNLTPRVRELLRITNSQPMFEPHDNEAAAIESMR